MTAIANTQLAVFGSNAGGELRMPLTASEMAKTFDEATKEIERLMHAIREQSERLGGIFDAGDSYHFKIDFDHHGERHSAENFSKILEKMKRCAWEVLINHLGIKNVMSVKVRSDFERQMREGTLPDITEENILGLIGGLVGQAQDFARDAAKEVFDILRPRGRIGGAYKTNDAFRVGRRVILPWYVERQWNGKTFRPKYHHEKEIIAIDGVFHLLDGKGVMRENRGPLYKAIDGCPGYGETEYFKFKCFKNGNLHLEMKRLDLVKQLNGLAAGEFVLGEDPDE